MKIDSIFFDLDGTLWDSTKVVLKSWNEVIKNDNRVTNLITKQQLEGVMGLQIPEIGRRFFPDIDCAIALEIMLKCCSLECDLLRKEGGLLYPDLEKTLKLLSDKYPLFIISNCIDGYIQSFLEYHKLSKYFKGFKFTDSKGHSKGENIKETMRKYNVKHPVYVGDTEGDHKAAKFAEIPFIYASYGFGEVDGYDYKINSFSELLGLIK